MSEIDIEAVRESLRWLGGNIRWSADYSPRNAKDITDKALSALDQLAKENERMKAELLKSGEGANEVDRELGRVMRERDQAHAYNAQQDLVIDTLRTKHAAMQEAIVEAVRRADDPVRVPENGMRWGVEWITEPLRPHLPTPELETVDPLVGVVEDMRSDGYINPTPIETAQRLRAALSARGLEVRKIGEGDV